MAAIAILPQPRWRYTQTACNHPKYLHLFFHISCSLMSSTFLSVTV